LGWEPETTLEAGLAVTYRWIRSEMAKHPENYQLDGGRSATGGDLALVGRHGAAEEMSAAD
jgi:hypothetical protein